MSLCECTAVVICFPLQEDDQIYGQQDRLYSTKFEDEPLYQWYAKDKIIRTNRQLSLSDASGSGEDTESSTDDSISGELEECHTHIWC